MTKYFIFVDETGNNAQERFFGMGCLLVPVDKIGIYHELLKKKYQQIHGKVKEKEAHLLKTLPSDELVRFFKGRQNTYEMKFKNINPTTEKTYHWLISQYFKFDDVKFCCLVIDKDKYSGPDGMSYFDVYINQLSMLLRNNVNDSEFVVLPDDITVPRGNDYETQLRNKLIQRKRKCFGVHRIESHSSLFLQMVDVLTGAVVYEFKGGEKVSKKAIVQKIQRKLGVSSLVQNFTTKMPNYFSVWVYKKT